MKIKNFSDMAMASKSQGDASKSNGSLMRIAPMAIYGYKLSDEEITKIVIQGII